MGQIQAHDSSAPLPNKSARHKPCSGRDVEDQGIAGNAKVANGKVSPPTILTEAEDLGGPLVRVGDALEQ